MSGSTSSSKSISDLLDAESKDSNDMPVGALIFEKSGDMRLLMMDDKNEDESASILLITDFFHYALNREDWMKEFADIITESTKDPFLTLIHGGLGPISGSQQDRILN